MFDISLIVPTFGRYDEVEKLLQSFSTQNYPLKNIEILIIDQNDKISLAPIVDKFSFLHIKHIKSNKKGIAYAKNLGISLSSGTIITFPDDDCTYFPDTVSSAIGFFQKNNDVDIAYGRIYDRDRNCNVMRNWPKKKLPLTLQNFHLNYSAITCFTRRRDILFDNRFGVGAYYSSGEELDYIISALKKKVTIVYTPGIDIWHPELSLEIMPLKKIYEYAKGYGAICKKHAGWEIYFLFSKSVIYHLLLIIKYIILFKRERILKHYLAVKGRLVGFRQFEKCDKNDRNV